MYSDTTGCSHYSHYINILIFIVVTITIVVNLIINIYFKFKI